MKVRSLRKNIENNMIDFHEEEYVKMANIITADDSLSGESQSQLIRSHVDLQLHDKIKSKFVQKVKKMYPIYPSYWRLQYRLHANLCPRHPRNEAQTVAETAVASVAMYPEIAALPPNTRRRP